MSTPCVILDIEGTTTSISFVFDVLFPYAAATIPGFLAAHAGDPEVDAARAAIAADAIDAERGLSGDALVNAVVRRQMAGDVKATGLKQLQGLVWRHGYESGAIKGHVYEDVPTCLRRWREGGRTAAIYSSGSVLAQQLLFRHSIAGDLTPLLAAHFDTTTGPKREAASYVAIAKALGRAPAEVTFCTDIPAEAQAAAAAGMHPVILMRPGNAPIPGGLPFAVHADLMRV